MPLPNDKQIHVRRATDGFSLEGATADSQTNGENTTHSGGSGSKRTFTTTAERFGPLEPGEWAVTFCNETTPGVNGIPPVVYKIGSSSVTAVNNEDHIFDLRGWTSRSATGSGIDYAGGGGTFTIENTTDNYISMVGYVGLAAGKVLASFQKLR